MARLAARGWSGHETCGSCFQTYAYGLEVRCVACDEPICPFCAALHGLLAQRVCPGCAAASEEAAEPREAR